MRHLNPSIIKRSMRVEIFSMLKSYVNRVKNHLVEKYSESMFYASNISNNSGR
jgi:hypothetical protein